MKLLLLGMLLFSSANAFALSLYSCPRILEMIDYNPTNQKPTFVEMADSKISLGPDGLQVRMAGREWSEISITFAAPEQQHSKNFYSSYLMVLFGVAMPPEMIDEVRWMTLTEANLPEEEQDPIQAFEVVTADRTFRYLQFSRADLAICADPVGHF